MHKLTMTGLAVLFAMTAASAPRRNTAAPEGIYGYLSFDVYEEQPLGMYRLDDDYYELLWEDPLAEEYGIPSANGWLVDGKIKGTLLDTDGFMLYDYGYFVIDFQTGQLEKVEFIDLDSTDIFIYMSTLNPEDGRIYGYAYNWGGGGELPDTWWVSADLDDLSNAEPIKIANTDRCYSLCYNEAEQCFYGVNIRQQFVKIDIYGNQTVVATVPEAQYMATYQTGLVWNPADNLFYWNFNTREDESGLFSITPEGEFEFLADYPAGEEFNYFVTTNKYVAVGRPATPTVKSHSFEGPSLSGSITFGIPATYGDGAPLPQTVNYTALLDGREYSTGTATPGTDLTVNFTVEDNGFHTFGLRIAVGQETSGLASVKLYVGNDTPKTPADVTLTTTQVSWQGVTEGVNGGYIDPSRISYIVYLNNSKEGETAATSYAISLPEDASLTSYVASVVATFEGLESAPGLSNRLLAGTAYSVPMTLVPTEEEFATMTVCDVNSDGSTWSYDLDKHAVRVGYSEPDEPMDDYLFLPPVQITDADNYYKVSLESTIRSAYYPEEFLTVEYATLPDPKAIRGTIIAAYTPSATYNEDTWNVTESLWKVAEPGIYYIALHCTSEGDQYGIAAREFKVEATSVTADSPAAAGNLQATGASGGVLEATVSFTFPTENLLKETLGAGTELRAVVSLDTSDRTYTLTGTPGSEATIKIATAQGTNTVTVEIWDGGKASPEASVTVYTGIDAPSTPKNFTADVAPDLLSVLLTWDPVTTPDTEGGYIYPKTVTYSVYTYVDYGMYQAWELIEEGIEDTSYLITIPAGSPQGLHVYGLTADNEAGSNGRISVLNNIYLGTPYELPLTLQISADGNVSPAPWLTYKTLDGETYRAGWFVDDLDFYIPFAPHVSALVGYATGELPCRGALGIPRFSTKGLEGVSITLTHGYGEDKCAFSLWGLKYGRDEMIKIGEYAANTEGARAVTSEYALPAELLGQDWVQVYIFSEYTTARDIFLLSGCEIAAAKSGVETVDAQRSISAIDGAVIVKGFEGERVVIATIDGMTAVETVAASRETAYPVPPGLYIVKAGATTRKLIVR